MKGKYIIDCFVVRHAADIMKELNTSVDKNPDYEPLSIGGASATICLLFKKI